MIEGWRRSMTLRPSVTQRDGKQVVDDVCHGRVRAPLLGGLPILVHITDLDRWMLSDDVSWSVSTYVRPCLPTRDAGPRLSLRGVTLTSDARLVEFSWNSSLTYTQVPLVLNLGKCEHSLREALPSFDEKHIHVPMF